MGTLVNIDCGSIDWVDLVKQKATLIDLACIAEDREGDHIDGILNLIDYIQDVAAETLGDRAVFGKDFEESDSFDDYKLMGGTL